MARNDAAVGPHLGRHVGFAAMALLEGDARHQGQPRQHQAKRRAKQTKKAPAKRRKMSAAAVRAPIMRKERV